MIQEDDVLPRATEPAIFVSEPAIFVSASCPFGYKPGESIENNKAPLFFSG